VCIGSGIGGLIFALYKYESPVSIYYRIKDAISGMNYGKKIKKIKDEETVFNTNTIYANNLLFERDKLLFQLSEDYNEEHFKLDNLLKKSIDKQEKEKDELQYLEEKMNNINARLKEKLSGAQDYELHVQKEQLKEKISKQKNILLEVNQEVVKNTNALTELDKIYDNEQYYIKNAYCMRYGNYVERIQDKLIKTKYDLNVISFEELTVEEGE
jgi:hypothetical protein